MVNVTKLMYEMISFVNYDNWEEPYGCFILFHGLRAIYVYIHVIYIVMMRVNQDGGAMDLGATPVE